MFMFLRARATPQHHRITNVKLSKGKKTAYGQLKVEYNQLDQNHVNIHKAEH